MPPDRTAAGLRALLRWLALLGEGNIVVERWRDELLRELTALEEGKEEAA